MYSADLRSLQINCGKKEEQKQMLREMLTTTNDRLLALLQNTLTPWTLFTNPEDYYQRQQISGTYTDWEVRLTIQQIDMLCY